MFEDIKNNQVVNGIRVTHVREKTPREQLLGYGVNILCRKVLERDYARERLSPAKREEKEEIVKKMFNEYEAYKSIR